MITTDDNEDLEYLMNRDYIKHSKEMDKVKIALEALKDLYHAGLISGESYKNQVKTFVRGIGYNIDTFDD